MPTIAEIRSQYPQYSDMSDGQLADALYSKFYSDMPKEAFQAKIGLAPSQATPRPLAGTAGNRHMSYEEGAALLDQEGAGGGMLAGAMGFLDGMPVVGSLLTGGVERGAAGLSAAIGNGKSYDQNLQQAKMLTGEAQDKHPYVTAGANVAGAVGGTLPMIAAAPAAFGAGTGNLFMRSLASAASGMGIGGADSAVRSGGDLEAVQNGAVWGTLTGAAGPAAGRVVGSAARGISNGIRNVASAREAGTSVGAIGKLYQSMLADGLDDAKIRSRLAELGPDGMLADLGPNLRGRASALAAIPGQGQTIVRDALNSRQAGANARIGNAVDETMGRSVVPSQVEGSIEVGQRSLVPRYDSTFESGRAVDTSAIAGRLESQAVNLRGDAQKAVQRVRAMLDIPGTDVLDPNPGALFQTRQAIDGLLATEANPQTIRQLSLARREIDDALSTAVPGVKEVDAQFAELARQRGALQRGQTVLDSGRTAPRPSELAAEVEQGALPQGAQIGPSAVPFRMTQGARAEVDRILGSNANDVAALNRLIKSDGDWNRARLASLFGQDKADRLFRVLGNERTFAETRDAALGNSATAGRQQAIAELGGGREVEPFKNAFVNAGVSGTARAGALKVADRLLAQILGNVRQGSNTTLAEAITSNRSALVDALAARGGRRTNTKTVEDLTRAILLGAGTTGSR